MPKSAKRKTYSESVKRQAVCDILVKHHSKKSVARRLHCSPNSLCDWLKKYRQDVLPQEEQQPAFASVRIPSEVSSQTLEIITPDGFMLRLPAITPVSQIAELFRSLVSQC